MYQLLLSWLSLALRLLPAYQFKPYSFYENC